MIWKYKTLLFVPVITIGFLVFIDISKLSGLLLTEKSAKHIETFEELLQILCTYTLWVVLKKHNERRWQTFPVLQVIIVRTIFAIINFNSPPDAYTGNYKYIMFAMLGVFVVSYVYFIVSVFTVKTQAIKTYFKYMGLLLVFSTIAATTLQLLIYAFYGLATWNNVGRYIFDAIGITPTFITLWMLYSLYIKHEVFHPGDTILTKKNFEDLPAGTTGTILSKHANSNYYEVEFADTQGNLLNTLSIGG